MSEENKQVSEQPQNESGEQVAASPQPAAADALKTPGQTHPR